MRKRRTAILMCAVVGMLAELSACTPGTVRGVNNYVYEIRKEHDITSYTKKKQVEDTCRAMISSYESDRLVYEQYAGSEDKLERSWADQAKMRANKTALSYNNYALKNSFVWQDNVPEDIKEQLPTID